MINRCALAGLLLITAQTAQATTPLGEINIELRGNVVDFTCVVEAGDSDKTVQLGRWPTKQLRQAGSTTSEIPFTLKLTGCPPGSASITFSGTPDTQDSTLLKLNGNSQASNVAVEIRDKDRTRLPLEQASQAVAVDALGNATLQFFARYIATANDPQPGVADADATFMINYN
ncbi:fimbria assembly protein [Trabulsiella odontotermitis]|uniref:fimbria assembly protein n=1 Tax=Trabulsiella odontotermitis TaxID=379893 RepID=UPI0006761943|nr:fimbria assembly protein [Trabulsiella odontotermitis]KNC92881.1 adhesin [Trabulsiella odontotermitis]